MEIQKKKENERNKCGRQLRQQQVNREKEVDYRLRKGNGAESHAFAVGAYYFDFLLTPFSQTDHFYKHVN